MKILHVGYSDTKGGANIAMMRLHHSLIKQKIDSKVLVVEKLSNDPNVLGPSRSLELIINDLKQILVRQKKYFFKNNEIYSHSVNFFKSSILKKINEINPDVVNLHWVNNELLSIEQIGKIKKPIVWTFLDMWPMCGGEHYTNTSFYKEGYAKNNDNKNKSLFDLNSYLWKKKMNYWNNKSIYVVCISEWLKKKAQESQLFKDSKIYKINCDIDPDIWKPVDKKTARQILNLPKDKKLFLFVSTNGVNDLRKGFKFIDNSLKKILEQRNDFELIVVGKNKGIENKPYKFKIIDNISGQNTNELRLLYSACDILLAPSLMEAFGQVASEASSCGTPTVAFNDTGLSDIINHKKNGYLSKYLDQDDFTKGVEWLLSNIENENIVSNCLEIFNEKFSNLTISKKYIEIYKSIKDKN